jgi:hypothetical protein
MAESTKTGFRGSSAFTKSATCRIRSAFATELPPNFITIINNPPPDFKALVSAYQEPGEIFYSGDHPGGNSQFNYLKPEKRP